MHHPTSLVISHLHLTFETTLTQGTFRPSPSNPHAQFPVVTVTDGVRQGRLILGTQFTSKLRALEADSDRVTSPLITVKNFSPVGPPPSPSSPSRARCEFSLFLQIRNDDYLPQIPVQEGDLAFVDECELYWEARPRSPPPAPTEMSEVTNTHTRAQTHARDSLAHSLTHSLIRSLTRSLTRVFFSLPSPRFPRSLVLHRPWQDPPSQFPLRVTCHR